MQRQKWEYLLITAGQGQGRLVRVWFINGRELREWPNSPPLHEYVNQLGEEGWEMVSGDNGGAVLKRPKL